MCPRLDQPRAEDASGVERRCGFPGAAHIVECWPACADVLVLDTDGWPSIDHDPAHPPAAGWRTSPDLVQASLHSQPTTGATRSGDIASLVSCPRLNRADIAVNANGEIMLMRTPRWCMSRPATMRNRAALTSRPRRTRCRGRQTTLRSRWLARSGPTRRQACEREGYRSQKFTSITARNSARSGAWTSIEADPSCVADHGINPAELRERRGDDLLQVSWRHVLVVASDIRSRIRYHKSMEPQSDLVVQHRSMADAVTERTRRLILSRKLEPGQRIRQSDLAEMMGVSTMPVREALLRLVTEGMVLADSNKSFTIAMTTTPAGIRDVYWIHAMLAGELAARAWDARDDELLATMNRHHETYIEALEAGTSGRETELFAENWAFHSAIHHKANAPAILIAVKNTLRYFPDFSLDIPGWYEVGAVWQEQLIRQFEKGTREGARKAVVNGSSKSAELYIAALWPGEARGVEAGAAGPVESSGPEASASAGQAKSRRRSGKTRGD